MSIIPKQWHPSWNPFLNKETINELKNIESKLGLFYPQEENVLRFLKLNKNNIKCIIVGMEPYASDFVEKEMCIPQATGRSFEVASLKNWQQKFSQSSLRNILKTIYYNDIGKICTIDEIRKKIKEKSFKILNPSDWFYNLEQQGVLFLNATLTVEPHNVNSHTLYWESFMNQLIQFLDKNDLIWLLWGRNAQDRVIPNIKKNYIKSVHPRLNQFVNENCFQYVKTINWKGIIL